MSLLKSKELLDKVENTWDIDVNEKVYQRLANEIFLRICFAAAGLPLKPVLQAMALPWRTVSEGLYDDRKI